MLYLVATPIGNLQDITLRAIEVLKSCDYILCEDTRHSKNLLQHYHIEKPLISFHKFNESSREDPVVKDLQEGKMVALISDAGTPTLQDPGTLLVSRCRKEGIRVTAIPGPSALIAALTLSEFITTPFQFVGFLPKKPKDLRDFLQNILTYEGTTICYESPHRIEKSLETLSTIDPQRIIGIARELTKEFEEYISGTSLSIYEKIKIKSLKGELVLLIKGAERKPHAPPSEEEIRKELRKYLQKSTMSSKEMIRALSEKLNIPKRIVYSLWNKEKNGVMSRG